MRQVTNVMALWWPPAVTPPCKDGRGPLRASVLTQIACVVSKARLTLRPLRLEPRAVGTQPRLASSRKRVGLQMNAPPAFRLCARQLTAVIHEARRRLGGRRIRPEEPFVHRVTQPDATNRRGGRPIEVLAVV